jgi:hypothetical protein
MAGGAETPNIVALPPIARLGACESARGPDADRHVKLLIQFAVEGSISGAYSQVCRITPLTRRGESYYATCFFRLQLRSIPMSPIIVLRTTQKSQCSSASIGNPVKKIDDDRAVVGGPKDASI